VPQRSAEEVAVALREACQSAKEHQRPVLLEFGASWCKDCRRLGSLSRIEPLAAELSEWQRLEVNITDPEPHEALLGSFGVHAIAHWEALLPTKCDVAPGRWKRVASRTVEPKRADAATAEQLAKWLTTARKRASALR
jgi:thiol-disulfide isomerase/thioredoxin